MKKAAVIAIIIAIMTLAIVVFARVNYHPQEKPAVTVQPAETPTATPSPEPTVRPSEVYTVTYKTTNRETGETAEKEVAVYLPEAYDANFGITGGGSIDLNELEQGWRDSGNADLDIAMFYIGEGDRDDRGPVELSYMTLRDYCDKFNEDNLKFTLMEGVGHDETEWIGGLKEALRLFFS